MPTDTISSDINSMEITSKFLIGFKGHSTRWNTFLASLADWGLVVRKVVGHRRELIYYCAEMTIVTNWLLLLSDLSISQPSFEDCLFVLDGNYHLSIMTHSCQRCRESETKEFLVLNGSFVWHIPSQSPMIIVKRGQKEQRSQSGRWVQGSIIFRTQQWNCIYDHKPLVIEWIRAV